MEGDSRPSSVSSLEQVMRFQPQSIKLMERLDKKLALEWTSGSLQRGSASWREATGVSTGQEQTLNMI